MPPEVRMTTMLQAKIIKAKYFPFSNSFSKQKGYSNKLSTTKE
eukprot:CAMPEP_0170555208 /NCGR_PEP_ID=MMETSP0211-20121228/13103_1 /TAXON_ID=311385 /ORGANISM="Pseudokeronopsis sp., Strain OXSARD2" /LENGTH=42 /DNA_ID= /DNA_START= /DNA_END= /DNA_ORIENTATION=